MQRVTTVKHLRAVDLPEFMQPEQRRRAEERALDEEILTLETVNKLYKAQIVRIMLDLAILSCLVLVLCALTR